MMSSQNICGLWMTVCVIVMLSRVGVAQNTADFQSMLRETHAAIAAEKKALQQTRDAIASERKALSHNINKAYMDLAQTVEMAKAAEQAYHAKQRQWQHMQNQASIGHEARHVLLQSLLRDTGTSMLQEDGAWADTRKAMEHNLTEQLDALASSARPPFISAQNTISVLSHGGQAITVKRLQIGTMPDVALGEDANSSGYIAYTVDKQGYLVGQPIANVPGSENHIPVDVTGQLANATVTTGIMGHYMRSGGWFIYPLVLIGVMGLALSVERLVNLSRYRSTTDMVDRVLAQAQKGQWAGALQLVQDGTTPLKRVFVRAIESRSASRQEREAILENAILSETPRLERSMTLLAACAGVAPLLGLLGTVSGMIETFRVMGLGQGGEALSQGISQALLTTQLGLVIAVPILLVHAYCNRVIDRYVNALDQAGHAMLGLEGESGD